MAWIEVHQSLLTHRKTVVAARTLGIPREHLVGHLVSLWLWALDNAPDGTVGEEAMVEFAAGWRGQQPLNIVSFAMALEQAGFLWLEGEPGHESWSITNWHEYAGKLIDRRERDAERQRVRRLSTVHPSDNRVTSNGTVPNPTQPYPTQPKGGTRSRASSIDEDFIGTMVTEFSGVLRGEEGVRERIASAMNHAASRKWIDKQRGVRDWLKRDAARVPAASRTTQGWENL